MPTTPVRVFRMSVSSTWYDEQTKKVREHEMHFKVARRGTIRSVRRYLAKRGTPYFQLVVYRKTGRWPPKRKVRISFEREEPSAAVRSDRLIQIEFRGMEGVGKRRRWEAYALPSRVLSYAKKKRKRKH